MLGATFLEKSRAAHSQTFNKAFNTTDSLFNSPVCEAAYRFFPVSARVASKRLLWLNKQRKGRRPLTMKLEGPKTHLHLPIIAIGAVKESEMKIFEIITQNDD